MGVIDLGLPPGITTCLFDLDGVLTDTAAVHAKAWAQMFDGYLKERAHQTGEPFRPFDMATDYRAHVDGKPRLDGVRDFLASRGIHLPEGGADDPPGALTVTSLGDRKNALVQRRIEQDGVRVYPGSRRYLEAAERAGVQRAVVSSSANTEQVLRVTGLASLVELRVDGVTIKQEGLRGKPAPDTFLAAARRLGVTPEQAAVFEDALAGVEAGRAGAFGCVIGVDRVGDSVHATALARHGADRVVADLDDLLAPGGLESSADREREGTA